MITIKAHELDLQHDDDSLNGKQPKTDNMPIASFHAYLDNIKAKTGKTPKNFRDLAKKKGFIKHNGEITVKATAIFNWLKLDFDLGRGHAMAIYHTFKEKTE